MLIFFWLACADAEFRPVASALSDYDRGQAALEEGVPSRAAAAFASAAEADPGRPVLRGWQAWALDQAGETQAALAVLDAALLAHPEASELRYNRAALRARLGQLEGAASDLRTLYAHDLVQPVEVGEDRDFLPLAADKKLRSLVPTAQVRADIRGELGSVLLGETFGLELEIVVRTGASVQVEDLGQPTGLLQHVRTVEDVQKDGPLWTRRHLRITFKAVAGGLGTIGPWLVKTGGSSALTGRVRVDVVALPGRTVSGEPVETSAVVLPSGVAHLAAPPWIGISNQLRVARLGPRHTLSPAVSVSPGPILELWSEGQVLWRQVPLPEGEHRILESGKVVASSD